MKNGAGQEVVAGARPVMVLDDPEAIARAAARGIGIGIGIAIAIAMLPLPHVLPA